MDDNSKPLQKPIYHTSNEQKPNDLVQEINKTVPIIEKQASLPLPLSNTDLHFDGLSEVPVEYSEQLDKEVKDQVKELKQVHEEPSICTSGPTAELQTLNQMQVPDGSSRLELSPTSVTQSISSISSPPQPQQKLQLVINGSTACITEEEMKNSPRPRLPPGPTQKIPSDGYNWRKYGQKQVKSPEGSRSYYRCTFSDCSAKKIECSDRSNRIVETVYRSHHNHDPPQILNCHREKKPVLRTATLGGSTSVTGPLRATTDLVQYTSKEPLPGVDKILETKEQESSCSDETMEVNANDTNVDGPESKKRKKRTSPDELESLPNSGNKPKLVVHAAGDVGISGDGYRWRKYGQKMVKGNPHPRNYYRCTSAGCPVRKQIERSVDSASALIITYKGGHNHDMPVPKKRHGPKSTNPNSGTSSVSGVDLKTDKNETHQSVTQFSAEKEGNATGESLNLGGNRTAEPARTLVSVGFEIKPC